MYKKAEMSNEQRRCLAALAGYRNDKQLQKTLEFAVSPAVRWQDTYLIPAYVSGNPNGRDLVWPWLQENWKELRRRYGKGNAVKVLDDFVSLVTTVRDAEREPEIREFFSKNHVPGIDMTLEQSLEKLRVNHKFLKANGGF